MYDEAIKMDPKYAAAYYNKGNIFYIYSLATILY